jgi:AcrR family transcriptional regulator
VSRSALVTRKRIREAAYRLFRRQGFSRVSMDEIALAANLTKRTLYHHYGSKDHLLSDVLEAQHELALQAFRTFGDKLIGSPEAIVTGMFQELAVWADKPRWAGSGFTRLVIELADLPGHPARVIARRHKAQLERCLAELLENSGAVERARSRGLAVIGRRDFIDPRSRRSGLFKFCFEGRQDAVGASSDALCQIAKGKWKPGIVNYLANERNSERRLEASSTPSATCPC